MCRQHKERSALAWHRHTAELSANPCRLAIFQVNAPSRSGASRRMLTKSSRTGTRHTLLRALPGAPSTIATVAIGNEVYTAGAQVRQCEMTGRHGGASVNVTVQVAFGATAQAKSVQRRSSTPAFLPCSSRSQTI